MAWLRSLFARRNPDVRSLERRLDEVEDTLATVLTRFGSLRGQLLTLNRRITRVQSELEPDLFDDDEGDEVDELIQQSRRSSSS